MRGGFFFVHHHITFYLQPGFNYNLTLITTSLQNLHFIHLTIQYLNLTNEIIPQSPNTMSVPRPSKVWLISGANTGFGLELSLKALSEGDRVIAAVRNPAKAPAELKGENVAIIAFDLSWNQEKAHEFIKLAWDAFGRIDVVVNNAAYAYMGAIEEST